MKHIIATKGLNMLNLIIKRKKNLLSIKFKVCSQTIERDLSKFSEIEIYKIVDLKIFLFIF